MCEHNCITSLKQKKTTDCKIATLFDFGTALETMYPLLNLIFERLEYEDLKSAALVNDTWCTYANNEFQKRNGASWISLLKSKNVCMSLKKSNNFKYDSVSFALIFYQHTEIKLNKYLCVHGDLVTRMTFAEYLSNEICPPNVEFWALSCPLVYSPISEEGHRCSFTGVLIPEIPNIKVKNFYSSHSDIRKCFTENFPIDEHIHCILLFTPSYPIPTVKMFIKEALSRPSHQLFALGGGVISGGIKPFPNRGGVFKRDVLFGLAMTHEKDKSPEFDAYSVVIIEVDDVEERFLEFKSNIQLREHSFAIRICCNAKDGKETETASFNKVFPKTFVIGLDADGEIGWNKLHSWKSEQAGPQDKKAKLKPPISHEYTTVIVLITWGRKLQKET